MADHAGTDMAAHKKSIQQRINEYARPVGDCLIWFGQRSKSGYSKTKATALFSSKKYDRVSRIILAMRLSRDLNPSEFAMHTCDTPACVNPEHIILGNALLNNRDTVNKGRRVNGFGKTAPEIKDKIVNMYLVEKKTQLEISKIFNISQVRVSQVVLERSTNASIRN